MKKIDYRILIIIILTIIFILMCFLYFKDDGSSDYDYSNYNFNTSDSSDSSDDEKKVSIQATAEVQSALSENISLHATYYLKESYVSENQYVKKGTKILKYTNGTYLKAPYDCVITSINIPEEGEQCTNNHYIGISSNNSLKVEVNVSESKIDSVSLGDEATIKLTALSDKTYEGIITNISSIASNNRFTVTIEFENDDNAYIGMTANVTF